MMERVRGRRGSARVRDPLAFSGSSVWAPTVRRMLDTTWPDMSGASLAVAPDDDMYAFGVAVMGDPALSAMAYFRAGASMVDVVEAVAGWHFDGLDHVDSFLDCAGGYGRATRFFAERLGPDRVTVGEIQADALEFQAREFHVGTLRSGTDPAQLVTPRRYSFVFVASLFSHLPRATFTTWLARLWELVAPGGVLVFSVHDEVLDEHDAPWVDGHAFLSASEVAELDTEDYGTAFTTEAFVREQLEQTVGAAAKHAQRLPRALCFHQDVWVVPDGRVNPEPLRYECGPQGTMDICVVDDRTLTLAGWAADAGESAVGAQTHPIARVEVSVSDGTRATARLGRAAHDVAEHFKREGDPNYENPGWDAELQLRRRARPSDIVTVVASCVHGRSYVLDSARLDDASGRYGREPMTAGPIERRRRTARLVYANDGAGALVKLIPTVAHNERERLTQAIRTAAKR
jgi:SAM-dependent methyltransferase